MIYELVISIYKKLRSKVSVKKTKAKIRKTVIAIRKSRFVKQVRVFVKDTHDTFTVPLYSKLQESLRNVLSSPAVSRFKPVASAIQVAWRFTTKKLSNLPQLALVAAILTPLFSTIILEVHNNRLYGVSQEEKTILTNTSVKKDLIKDTADAFLYNRGDELTIPGSDDPKLKQLLFAASKEDSTGKEPYQAKLPKNPREGIVFGDAEGNRQFTITPNHGLSAGQLDEDSRIVYPKSTTERHIYTLKTNGIKNDITLLEAPEADSGTNGSIKTYTYSLDLGDSLEARKLPNGDIGIYSADPALFGNVQVGDEKSQELIDKARSSNEKNTLVFEIPKPFIIDSNRKINYDDVSFKLVPNQQNQSNPTLELEVRNLKNLPYPVSIDPTIVVTTTSDFQQNIGNNDNIDTSINGQITRGSLGSGAIALGSPELSSAATDTSSFFSIPRNSHTTIAYNGYMYVLGGIQSASATTCKDTGTSQYCNDVQYAPINADGTLGTWARDTTSYFDIPRGSHTSVAYNGYMYVLGGIQSASATTCKDAGTNNYCNDVQYAPINADGTLGTWARDTTSYFDIPREVHTTVVVNGYMYVLGGYQSASATTCKDAGTNNYCNDVQYALINADGTLGTWTRDTTSYFSTPRGVHATVAYNGYMYVLGGQTISTTECKDTGTGSYCNDVQYAPINSDGTLGTWTTDTSSYFSIPRGRHTSVAYNGYMYVLGGNQEINATTCKDTGNNSYCNDVQYLSIGELGNVGTTDFTTTRINHTSVVYNGYLYIIGGGDGTSVFNDIQYCPINSNGSVGICVTQTSAFTNARSLHTSVVYNGYLYIIGGWNGTTRYNDIIKCLINPTGSVTCDTTPPSFPTFTTARTAHTSVAYNGYLYVIGGGSPTLQNDIQRCPINSNGSVGTCAQQTNAFTTARSDHTSVVYNGYLYIIGGWNGTTRYNDIQRCPIKSDGSVDACVQQNSAFTNARYGHSSVVYNGYLYIVGGNTLGGRVNDIQYCPINANGSVGTCIQQGSAFTTARDEHTSVIYGGYLYIAGGTNGTTRYNDIQAIPIVSAGRAGPVTTNATGITGNRSDYASAIYNGVMYITGGWDGTTYYDDIQRCTISTTDGTVGSCTTQSNMFAARREHSAVAYNGFLYIIGGFEGVNKRELVWLPINADGSIGTTSFASGGKLTSYIADGTNGTNGSTYYVHTFGAGTSTFNTNGVNRSSEYMVLGGGGGGGGASLDDYGGGGGAGGLVHNVGGTLATLTGSYTITVGSGGAGGSGAAVGSNGGNSSLGAVASVTGGGASQSAGGSGGGGNDGFGSATGGAGTSGQGSAGGSAISLAAGGGGGENGVGAGGSSSSCGDYCVNYQGGNGGSGISLNITGSGVSYAGGGGGGAASSGGLGGSGIGGSGSSSEGNGGNAVVNTGSGGGGAVQGGTTVTRTGGSGSDGLVIIRYVAPTTNLALFNTARRGHTSFVYNNYLYIVGGLSGSTYLRSVERCAINANGSIGTCTDQSTALTISRHAHSSVNVGNKFYVIGGEQSGGSELNTIEVCDINGTTGAVTCSSQSTTFDTARRNHGSVYYNGFIYIIGGSDTWRGGTVFNDIQYCPISSTGTIGTCVSRSNVFSTPRSQFQPIVYNGILYAVAGWNGSSDQASIEYTRIGPPEGRGGSSTTNTTGFTTARNSHSSVAYNGYLYIIGGGSLNTIQKCQINTNGSLQSCTSAGTFTTARRGHYSVVYNGYIYVIGGWNGTTYYNDVQKCLVGSDANVTCSSAGTFTTARFGHAAVIRNNYIYVIGGKSASTTRLDTVQKCLVGSDANVTCTSAGTFTTARYNHSAVSFNGNIYIIGGWNDTNYYNDIQYCPVNSTTNDLDTCTVQGTAFINPRQGLSAEVSNEYIYIIGGWNGTTRYNDIQYCPINVNGSVGVCTQQASAFTNARYSHASTIFNGYLYINGGNASTGDLADIQYLPLLSTSETARYERTIDVGTTTGAISSYVIQGSANCTYTVRYKLAGVSNVYGSEVVSYNVLPNITQTIIGGGLARYISYSITLDDSSCGGTSNITALALTYNLIPNAPTLLLPQNGQVGVKIQPEFRLGTSDTDTDYLRYKIEVCSTSNCSSIVRTIDQTSSQTGWVSQSQQSGTAFSSGATGITQYAIHNYQTPALSSNTQYWWRGYAIDPNGTNIWSNASFISSFTTSDTTTQLDVNIGGTTIYGGTTIQP